MNELKRFRGFAFALLLTLMGECALAQVPQGIPYQAIARNGQGQPLANLPVKVRFSILDSTLTGTAVYSETHEPTTSPQGLFNVNVGMGNSTVGSFSSINWGANAKFLKVELDTTASGSNYIDLGTQQMMSVPYALYARTSGSIDSGNGNILSSNIDSTLKLFDGFRLFPGTHTVPIGEKWKIVAVNTTPNYGSALRTLNFSYCIMNTNTYNNTCMYSTQPIEILQINSDIYYAGAGANYMSLLAPNNNCSMCPASAQFAVPFGGSLNIGFPIWLSSGDVISFIDNSRFIVEKYRY